MSASSCEQGDNIFLLVAGGEQSTSSPFETLIYLPSITIFTTCSDKNRNSSFLLSKRKNSCQFRGTMADGITLLLAPVPLFCLVLAFKLLGIHSSHTKSSLCTFSIDCLMYGRKTFSLLFHESFTELRLEHLNAECTVQYDNRWVRGLFCAHQFIHALY